MDGKNFGTLFAEKGFVIRNSNAFIKEATNVDLTELVDKLTDLEKRINSSSNIVDFSKSIISKLDEIDVLINSDEYTKLSNSDKLRAFSDCVQKIRSKFAVVNNYVKAEENVRLQRNNNDSIVISVDQKSANLDKDTTLSPLERNQQVEALFNEKLMALNAYNRALASFNEYKKAYEKSVKNFNLVEFKNELLALANELQEASKELALSPENKEKLQNAITGVHSEIGYYGLESIKSKEEFDALCKRYGLESVGLSKKTEVVKDETIKEEKKDEVKKEKSLLESVYDKLVALNPTVKFALKDKANDKRFDGRIEASVPVGNLNLPEDFYHMNNGISNKFSTNKDQILVEIGELKLNNEKKETKELGHPLRNPDMVADVFKELVLLNPDVKFELKGKSNDARFDGKIEASKPASSLELPDGFYYMNNGISNKFSGDVNKVTIEIGELKQKEEKHKPKEYETLNFAKDEENKPLVLDNEKNDEKPNLREDLINRLFGKLNSNGEPEVERNDEAGLKPDIIDKAQEVVRNLTKNCKVYEGKHYAVKKSRTAVIGSYAKTLLTFGGISTVILGAVGTPVLAAAAVGVGLGAAVQKLYSKLVANTDIKIEALEGTKYENDPKNAPVSVIAYHEAKDALMDIYKKRKTGEIKSKAKDYTEEELLDDISPRFGR